MDQLKAIARRALRERGFQPDFSNAALERANRGVAPSGNGDLTIRDLRGLLWTSIDNDSSRDLDQLAVLEESAQGVKVLVAIADVDAIVERGDPIDAHASANTVTVYTAAGIYPMLPERLSTDLTSLGEDEDRLALIIEVEVAEDGSIANSSVYRAQVRNQAKLAYRSVAAWLDGERPAPTRVADNARIAEQLRAQDRLARALRNRRFEHGALSLQTPRAEAVFEGNRLTDLRADSGNRAKELIEDFMIAANGVVARFLSEQQMPSVRRMLRAPARWPRIVALAREHGTELPSEPDATALSKFLSAQHEQAPAEFAELSLSVVKLLGRGEYMLDLPGQPPVGHFGLAANDYGHATAPNRRFADLVTQRLLKAALSGAPCPYGTDELRALVAHCNEQEANAAKIERQVEKSAAAQLLQNRIGQRFSGIVTGAADKGTWVRIQHPVTEGKIVERSEGLDVGDRVNVELLGVDVERGFIDFARVDSR